MGSFIGYVGITKLSRTKARTGFEEDGEMMRWYEFVKYSGEIRPIEIMRFTDTSIWVQGQKREHREAIENEWAIRFPTLDKALAYAKDCLTQRREAARATLREIEAKLENLK